MHEDIAQTCGQTKRRTVVHGGVGKKVKGKRPTYYNAGTWCAANHEQIGRRRRGKYNNLCVFTRRALCVRLNGQSSVYNIVLCYYPLSYK